MSASLRYIHEKSQMRMFHFLEVQNLNVVLYCYPYAFFNYLIHAVFSVSELYENNLAFVQGTALHTMYIFFLILHSSAIFHKQANLITYKGSSHSILVIMAKFFHHKIAFND